jgi:hypothetical protein
MSKALLAAGLLVAAASGAALAQPHQAQIVVATDRKTGRKFNCLKRPNGKMMAVVPINSLKGMPEVSEEDMIHS